MSSVVGVPGSAVLAEAFVDYKKYVRLFDKNRKTGLLAKVLDLHMKSKVFQSEAYARFFVDGSNLYTSVRELQRVGVGLSEDDFSALAWLRFRDGAESVRAVRGGGSLSLSDLFCEVFADEYVSSGVLSDVVERKVRLCYLAMLANTISGVLGERRVFRLLCDEFDGVVWGSDSDESCDVDVRVGVGAVPLSIKCGGAFSVESFDRYRWDQGKGVPVAYVGWVWDSGLHARVLRIAVSSGVRGLYAFGSVEELRPLLV